MPKLLQNFKFQHLNTGIVKPLMNKCNFKYCFNFCTPKLKLLFWFIRCSAACILRLQFSTARFFLCTVCNRNYTQECKHFFDVYGIKWLWQYPTKCNSVFLGLTDSLYTLYTCTHCDIFSFLRNLWLSYSWVWNKTVGIFELMIFLG